MKNKNKKLLKTSKIITQQPKTIENTNIIDIKSVIIKHPKTIRQAKKILQVGGAGKNSTSLLYSETTKPGNFF